MTARSQNVTRATDAIPPLIRTLITTLEPLLALSGAVLLLTHPQLYLSSLTRNTATSDPSQQWIYTQLAGGWLLIVFLEAVLLRLVDDVRVWRLVCWALLASDVCYTHACALAVGGWGEWVVVGGLWWAGGGGRIGFVR